MNQFFSGFFFPDWLKSDVKHKDVCDRANIITDFPPYSPTNIKWETNYIEPPLMKGIPANVVPLKIKCMFCNAIWSS